MAKSEIFRKKALDRVKSPEDLNDYVQVTTPGVWLLLAAIVVLLLGACAWGVLGNITVKVEAQALVENGQAVCIVDADKAATIEPGMPVVVDEVEGHVNSVDTQARTLGEVTSTLNVAYSEPDMNREVCVVQATIGVANGGYKAQIITETLRPFSFVTN